MGNRADPVPHGTPLRPRRACAVPVTPATAQEKALGAASSTLAARTAAASPLSPPREAALRRRAARGSAAAVPPPRKKVCFEAARGGPAAAEEAQQQQQEEAPSASRAGADASAIANANTDACDHARADSDSDSLIDCSPGPDPGSFDAFMARGAQLLAGREGGKDLARAFGAAAPRARKGAHSSGGARRTSAALTL